MILRCLKVLTVILVFSIAGLYISDRFVLAPVCPPCHTEKTRALPLFKLGSGAGNNGLVRIPAGFHFRARVGGFQNPDGEGVILLHGYPETSIMWTPLIKPLADAGYRVIAFDLRGYSPGARPGGVSNYESGSIAGDVIAVANRAGFKRFHLVGHDWGGLISWIAAVKFPDRVSTLSILSMPHPDAFRESLFFSDDQWRRSSYALLNWIPFVAEMVLRFNRAAYLRRFSWAEAPAEYKREYVDVFTEPGALEAVLKWYRAHRPFDDSGIGNIEQPTLYIWGYQDKALGRVGADKTPDHVTGPLQYLKLDAGHFLMTEAPEKVKNAILAHLKRWPLTTSPAPRNKLPLPPQTSFAECLDSKPHCLQINVNLQGELIQVVNKCENRLAGTVRLQCSKWASGAIMDYFFNLKPGGSMMSKSQQMGFGDCYYNQMVCAPR